MSLKGNLDTLYLNSILQLLHNDKKTGVFQATHNQETIKIYFQDGAVIFAMGARKEGRLGFLLRKQGLISATDLKECIISAKKKRLALGKYLVQQGHITKEKLKNILKKQTEEIILNLFLWEKGDFEYRDAKINLMGMVPTQINVMKIMLEASRRIDELSIFKKQIPDDNVVLKRVENINQKKGYKLTPNELKMLGKIDGKKSIKDLFMVSGFDTFAAYDEFSAYRILHSLLSSGLVEKLDGVNLGAATGAGSVDFDYSSLITVYNDIISWLCRKLESEIGNQIFTIFDECKNNIQKQSVTIFYEFHPKNPATTNIVNISNAIKKIGDDESKRKKILIRYFTELVYGILKKTTDILGQKFTQNLINEFLELLDQFKESRDKNQLIHHAMDHMNHHITQIK